MVSTMIYELGPTSPSSWEEVVLLLEDSDGKTSVLGGNGDDTGAHILGSSLQQITDPDVRSLFTGMAVAAEDVPVPMIALELVWCSFKSIPPPLGRMERIQLRRWCFQLIDRNLVLGETSSSGGIFMVSCCAGDPPQQQRRN